MNEREIFAAAMELPTPTERAAFLARACGDDRHLRGQVEALLVEQDQLGSFMESPVALPTMEPPPLERRGTEIGPYKLLQILGEGGMGVVYMADQLYPVARRVALKIIKPGMDTRRVIARFEAERQALALMDHPNIAKVLDAGSTPSGRPYFVMELVKGMPITQYCDKQQLTPKERLELFKLVCQAVQHAHQKGIIHRDLKPTNVLIALYDGRPVPKIIDFGLAKATGQRLTEKTMFTEVGTIVGTLEYMAPEQAELNNLDIDTRADIYSLGVILYELLTGSPPFSAKQLRSTGFAEMLRIIREQEPQRPSTKISSSQELPSIAAKRHLEPQRLTRLVRGDLDWIVMKCLEKQRERRYETANGLASDLDRYLRDEPALAGAPSRVNQLRKFIRRNKRSVAAAAMVFVAILLGAIGTTAGLLQAAWERNAKQEARDNAERSDRLAATARAAEQQARSLLLRAQSAEREVRMQEHLARARAHRTSGRPGQRFQSLAELGEAARLGPSAALRSELRDETIAALCLADLKPATVLPGFPVGREPVFDDLYQRYALLEPDGAVVVRDTGNHRELLRLPREASPWDEIRFTPDGRTLLCVQVKSPLDKPTRSWDLATRREGPQFVGAVKDISPDSNWLVTWVSEADGEVHRYQLPSGKRAGGARVGGGWCSFALHADGQTLAVCRSGTTLWNLEDGTRLPQSPGLEQVGGMPTFSLSGRFLAGANDDAMFRLWDHQSRRMQAVFDPVRSPMNKPVFNPSGDLLATVGWDETLRLWDPLLGRPLLAFQAPGTHRSFSKDGRLFGYTRRHDEITIWEVATASDCCRRLGRPQGEPEWAALAISTNGRLLAVGTPRGIRLLDAQRGDEVALLPGDGGDVQLCFDPLDGSLLVPGPTGLTRWPLQWSGGLAGTPTRLEIGPAIPADFGRKLTNVAIAGGARRAVVWDARQGSPIVIDLNSLAIVSNIDVPNWTYAAISPDGRWVATAPFRGPLEATTKVFEAHSGRLLHELPLDAISGSATGRTVGVAFTSDGKWLTTSSADRLRFWSTETWQEQNAIDHEGSNWPGSLAIAAQGSLLAYARTPTTIELRDPKAGTLLATLAVPLGTRVGAMQFSQDGSQLALTADPQAIFVFNLRRIRAALAEMELDWDQAAFEAHAQASSAPLTVTVKQSPTPAAP